MDIRIIEGTDTFLDYMPHIITLVSILATIIIVLIQHRVNINLHKRNSNFDARKEAIEDALDFLDVVISFRKTNSTYQALNKPIDDKDLTIKARRVHNKLCITCENKTIIELFLAIVVPDKGPFPIYDYYNEFRNECRKELGFEKIDLPKDKIYITIVSTKSLPELKEPNND